MTDIDRGAPEAWDVDWEAQRRRKFTLGLSVTPAERLEWLEEMIALAHAAGALPRRREGESAAVDTGSARGPR